MQRELCVWGLLVQLLVVTTKELSSPIPLLKSALSPPTDALLLSNAVAPFHVHLPRLHLLLQALRL